MSGHVVYQSRQWRLYFGLRTSLLVFSDVFYEEFTGMKIKLRSKNFAQERNLCCMVIIFSILFCCQKQNKLRPLSAHRVYLKINCQKATQILVLTLRRQAIFSPINQSAEERNLLSWVMAVVMMVGSGGVIKCVWLEAPIAQNLSTKKLRGSMRQQH